MTDVYRAQSNRVSYGHCAKKLPLTAAHRPAPQARIKISANAGLNYPVKHCRIAVIDQISPATTGDEPLDSVLKVDLVRAGGSNGGFRQLHVGVVAHVLTAPSDVALLLDPASMLGDISGCGRSS